ncbi:MAG: glycerophosphodiester phosphodiesterase family protein [Gemmatimonadota bacterium]|nr:glycerophosphodiester phosphodiesterase family protein [Gemmatimonadota bacterium]MDH5284884.1 glycerophosphodiester phosphodiesterase family protein [Gemmatimonadota bacterium]
MNLLLDLSAHPVIGHRGAAGLAPENTIPGFRAGLEAGAEAVELDVHLTSDGVAVVIHDPTLERTTDRRGRIAEMTAEAIQQADAGFRFGSGGEYPWRGRGVRVPTLMEVVAAVPDAPLLIELKTPTVGPEVARVLSVSGAADRAVVAAEDHRGLGHFDHPPFHRGASRRDIARSFFRFGRPATACACFAVPLEHYGMMVPSRRFNRLAASRGSTVHVWTVDDEADANRVWNAGAQGIVTNRPDLVRQWRDTRFPIR